jgi:hypothetical protein
MNGWDKLRLNAGTEEMHFGLWRGGEDEKMGLVISIDNALMFVQFASGSRETQD